MSFKDMIDKELKYETFLLKNYTDKIIDKPQFNLTCSVSNDGTVKLYRSQKNTKSVYIKKSDLPLLRTIVDCKITNKTIKILQRNISHLEKLCSTFEQYDRESVIRSLPKVYQHGSSVLNMLPTEESSDKKVIQSENPFRREDLIYTVSNGLMVRTKVEAAIAEILIVYGIEFRYEMALTLTRTYTDENGYTCTEKITKYPDFTIFMKDGTKLYWEHAGLLEDPQYRKDHFDKLTLYYENGIYEPVNLIVTVDGKRTPYNAIAYRELVENYIKPRC